MRGKLIAIELQKVLVKLTFEIKTVSLNESTSTDETVSNIVQNFAAEMGKIGMLPVSDSVYNYVFISYEDYVNYNLIVGHEYDISYQIHDLTH
jgi:hypothetical protein